MVLLPDYQTFRRGIPPRLRRLRTKPLTPGEIAAIARLHMVLVDVQRSLAQEAATAQQQFEARLAAGDANLCDYEIDARVDFYLCEHDPRHGDDALMMSLHTSMRRVTESWDHHDLAPADVLRALDGAPVTDMMHALTEYAGFAPFDLCRIGRVSVELIARSQRELELAPSPGRHGAIGKKRPRQVVTPCGTSGIACSAPPLLDPPNPTGSHPAEQRLPGKITPTRK